jgi:hypothetical protein
LLLLKHYRFLASLSCHAFIKNEGVSRGIAIARVMTSLSNMPADDEIGIARPQEPGVQAFVTCFSAATRGHDFIHQ